jgi:hypothetical protein
VTHLLSPPTLAPRDGRRAATPRSGSATHPPPSPPVPRAGLQSAAWTSTARRPHGGRREEIRVTGKGEGRAVPDGGEGGRRGQKLLHQTPSTATPRSGSATQPPPSPPIPCANLQSAAWTSAARRPHGHRHEVIRVTGKGEGGAGLWRRTQTRGGRRRPVEKEAVEGADGEDDRGGWATPDAVRGAKDMASTAVVAGGRHRPRCQADGL